jgi:hypothetical protein
MPLVLERICRPPRTQHCAINARLASEPLQQRPPPACSDLALKKQLFAIPARPIDWGISDDGRRVLSGSSR